MFAWVALLVRFMELCLIFEPAPKSDSFGDLGYKLIMGSSVLLDV